jgi:hypothetical protein
MTTPAKRTTEEILAELVIRLAGLIELLEERVAD